MRSLQIRTDLMLRSFAGEVIVRDGHIAVRTPDNPTFRWGNFVIFPEPPTAGDLQRWPEVFGREIGTPPAIDHLAFTWDAIDGNAGAADAFVAAGFERTDLATMSATSLAPPTRSPTPCVIRDLATDADWDDWIELAVAQNAALPEGEREGSGHREFTEQSCREYRAMIDAGWGRWFGAYVDDRLVATMGLFVRDGLGRFQAVDTHPEFRRRGLATTLLRHVSQEGFTVMGAHTLVIVADIDEVALDIYATAGFATTEHVIALEQVDRG